MKIDVDEWVRAALDAESPHLAELITSLPPSSTQSMSSSLSEGAALDSRVYALRSVSQDHSVGGDPELAVAVATVGIRFCERSYEMYGPGTANTFVFGIAQFAIDAHRAYDRMDQRENQLAIVENALKWLKARDVEELHLADLRIARVEALLEQGRLEEAREALDTEAAAGNTGHPSFDLLDQRIRSRLISATKRKDERSIEEQTTDHRQQTLKSAVKGLTTIAPEFAGLLKGLGAQIDEQRDVLSANESITRDSRIYQQLGNFLEGMAAGSGNQIRLNTTIQQASTILADPNRGNDPAALEQARQSLEAVRQEAIKINLKDTVIDTLWPLYICYKRLERYDEALDTLQSIRPWVSERRALIKDPLKRAGISKQYPHLYVELGARLIERGNSAELLSAIEEAKGRALADMLAVEAHQEGLLDAQGVNPKVS